MKVVIDDGPQPHEDPVARFARDVEPLRDVLARGARRLTRSDVEAEDLLQDTLLNAFVGWHTFQEGSNLKAWLFRILYNRWVSTYRVKQRRPVEVPVDSITEREMADTAMRLPAAQRSAEAQVMDALPDDDVKAALAALSDGFRAVIYYADIAGYTYSETAALLDIPVGTVMSRVSRGRQRLRIALAHLSPSPGEFAALNEYIA